ASRGTGSKSGPTLNKPLYTNDIVSCSAPCPGASGLNWTGAWYRYRLAELGPSAAPSPPGLPPVQPARRAVVAPSAAAAAAMRALMMTPSCSGGDRDEACAAEVLRSGRR